ncbi:MAG: dTDP-glucose 4,6-dehydratase [Planctomycetes bacterium]|nr:dTDP-glucose 4,6-dehydratase [Planctomycetota bacterium]
MRPAGSRSHTAGSRSHTAGSRSHTALETGSPADARSFRCVLVTGGAGFIGCNLVRWILEHRPQTLVINLDALTYAGNPANIADIRDHERHRFVHGDICDEKLVGSLLDEGVDAVINAAAHSHVDRSLMRGDEFVATNVGGVQVILDAIKARPQIRFVQVSTDEIYGSLPPDERCDENWPPAPGNPYAATKAAAELLALSYRNSFGLDVVISRCCNNFGPYHYPEKMIPLFITNLLDGLRVPLYGDGLNYREWIHVEDHCSALVAILESGRSGEAYNISSGTGLTNLELTRRILDLLGKDDSSVEYVKDRPGHDRRYALDSRKIAAELGWQPRHNLKDGLRATCEWFQANEQWWRPIKSGAYRKYYQQQYAERLKSAAI